MKNGSFTVVSRQQIFCLIWMLHLQDLNSVRWGEQARLRVMTTEKVFLVVTRFLSLACTCTDESAICIQGPPLERFQHNDSFLQLCLFGDGQLSGLFACLLIMWIESLFKRVWTFPRYAHSPGPNFTCTIHKILTVEDRTSSLKSLEQIGIWW